MYKFILIISLLITPYKLYANENTISATIKLTNKVSGKNYIYKINKNENIKHKILKISIEECIINTKNLNEFAAYIMLHDAKKNRLLFNSWILSNNVSISQISHPIYSIKLIKCNTS